MTFKEGLHNRAKEVDTHLDTFFLNGYNHYETHLHDSMRYSLLAGGKRIRPILLIEVGKLFGVSLSQLIDYACALEMIHTYSLIHDDLPAMDDDDLRRGKATNHKVYGEAIAILSGDGLLNYAYEVMSKQAITFNDMNYVKAMHVIASAAGHHGMIGGQVADIMSEGKDGTADVLEYIHGYKTGALLTCALVAGGHIAGVDEETINQLEQLGKNIGLIFQIKDDLLDIESTEEVLGKPIGSDDKNKKLTYPSFYGVEASNQKIHELVSASVDILNSFDGDTSFLLALIDFLKERQH